MSQSLGEDTPLSVYCCGEGDPGCPWRTTVCSANLLDQFVQATMRVSQAKTAIFWPSLLRLLLIPPWRLVILSMCFWRWENQFRTKCSVLKVGRQIFHQVLSKPHQKRQLIIERGQINTQATSCRPIVNWVLRFQSSIACYRSVTEWTSQRT